MTSPPRSHRSAPVPRKNSAEVRFGEWRLDAVAGGLLLRNAANRRPTIASLNSVPPVAHAFAMDPLPWPLAFFFLLFSGWVNRQPLAVIEYLLEENRVLRTARGSRRLCLTDDQRRRLAVERQSHRPDAIWCRSPASSHRIPFCGGIASSSPRNTTARRGDALIARVPSRTSRRSLRAWQPRTRPGGTRGSAAG